MQLALIKVVKRRREEAGERKIEQDIERERERERARDSERIGGRDKRYQARDRRNLIEMGRAREGDEGREKEREAETKGERERDRERDQALSETAKASPLVRFCRWEV